MTSLKQEMRQRFEKHSSMAFYENNSGFEEGLLEKIMNLTYANLSPYSSKRWNITAVKSPVLLQKLYKAANEIKIADSAIALIICGSTAQASEVSSEYKSQNDNESVRHSHEKNDQQELELLALSLGYAAKYFCIDYFVVKAFDSEPVLREFALDRQHPAVAIICLGCFKDDTASRVPSVKYLYSDTVRII